MDTRLLTRKQAIKKINEMFDELEQHPHNNDKFKVMVVIENGIERRPNAVSLRRGWKNNAECSDLVNGIFSLDNFAEPW